MTDTPGYDPLIFVDPSSEDELVQVAVDRMRISIPEWVPDASQTEMVLLEALAVMVGMEVFAVNQLPQTMLEQLLTLYGISRSEGTPPRAVVEFGVNESSPVQTIPAGTRVRFTLEDTGETFDLITDEELSINTSETLADTVTATGEEPGSSINGVHSLDLDVVDPLHFVEHARLHSPLTGGTDPEDDENLWDRGSTVLARQVGTLVLTEHFQLAALTDPRVGWGECFLAPQPRPTRHGVGWARVRVRPRPGRGPTDGRSARRDSTRTDRQSHGRTAHPCRLSAACARQGGGHGDREQRHHQRGSTGSRGSGAAAGVVSGPGCVGSDDPFAGTRRHRHAGAGGGVGAVPPSRHHRSLQRQRVSAGQRVRGAPHVGRIQCGGGRQ